MAGQIANSLADLVGRTPLLRLGRIGRDLPSTLLAKCEFLNPLSSNKDRIGLAMIEDARSKGHLQPGQTIVEATSGNTGLALAWVAAARGYPCLFVVPDKVSQEKIALLRAFGAEVVVTPTVESTHPEYYETVARNLAAERGGWLAHQFENPANPAAHERTTGPEIWEQTGGRVDVLVSGMGTGGTITGAGRYLKRKNPAVRVVGADPRGSSHCSFVVHGHAPESTSTYQIEGIGGSCVPGTLDLSVVDDCITVEDREAFLAARWLAATEGVLTGGSSGAVLVAAVEEALRGPAGRQIVLILADSGERYASKIYNDEWMEANGHGTGLPEIAGRVASGPRGTSPGEPPASGARRRDREPSAARPKESSLPPNETPKESS